jgi:hypothetical protein
MLINKNERIDDLQYKGLKIIQNKSGFCFGIDAVLLANFAKNMEKLAEGYWTAELAKYDMTLEEDISESGMTEEDYLASIYKETGIDKMITSMNEITNKTLNKISKLKGMYTTPLENELRLYHSDTEYESMEYSFKGKTLNIIIQGEDFSLLVECEKNK